MSFFLLLEIYVILMTLLLLVIVLHFIVHGKREKRIYYEFQKSIEIIGGKKRFETHEEAVYVLQKIQFPLAFYTEAIELRSELNLQLVKISFLYPKETKAQ